MDITGCELKLSIILVSAAVSFPIYTIENGGAVGTDDASSSDASVLELPLAGAAAAGAGGAGT